MSMTTLSVCSLEEDGKGISRVASAADSGVGPEPQDVDDFEAFGDALGVTRVTLRTNGGTAPRSQSTGADSGILDRGDTAASFEGDNIVIGSDTIAQSRSGQVLIEAQTEDATNNNLVTVTLEDASGDITTPTEEVIGDLVEEDRVLRVSSAPGSPNKTPSSPQPHQPGQLEDLRFVLPSDRAWRNKNYFKLVEKQRTLGATPMASAKDVIIAGPSDRGLSPTPTPTHWQPLAKRPPPPGPQLSIASSLSIGSAASQQDLALPPWSSTDLAKAGQLFAVPPFPVDFEDEAEMRRVFALAYDVFRYKDVLQEALEDCGFYKQFPQHEQDTPRAWLLLYDLHKRRFRPREAADIHQAFPFLDGQISRQVLAAAGLAELDDNIWDIRVHLAAALARLRVKRRALRLSELLPLHLQDGRTINHEDALVTGWVNTFKTTRQQVCSGLDRQGLRLIDDGLAGRERTVDAVREGAASVSLEDYRFDPILPNLIVCHPEQRDDLAQAALVRKCYLVLQDRAFCFGPAMVGKLLADYDLSGCVAQTHILSPRSTAYLAALLADNVKIESLLAFGAGTRKSQYKAYFRKLGVTNAEIYEERFLDIHETSLMDNVVAVLATPPNSFSAVTDPVDLVCSRGGDFAMLRQLTESGATGASRDKEMLREQAATLRLAMAKPQVQFVIYETHSVFPSENERLVKRMVKEMNTLAEERHAEEQRKAAWLASIAAAADQGIPGDKRGKQSVRKDPKKPPETQVKDTKPTETPKEAGKELESVEKNPSTPALQSSTTATKDEVKSEKLETAQSDQIDHQTKETGTSSVNERSTQESARDETAQEAQSDKEEVKSQQEDRSSVDQQKSEQETAQDATDKNQEFSDKTLNTTGADVAPGSPTEVVATAPESTPEEKKEIVPVAPETTIPVAPAEAPTIQVRVESTIEIPACDSFEIGHMPDMCPLNDSCLRLQQEGCYLALIKRKEIIRMDANYMIKMAEARGLFGCATGTRRTTAAERARRKKEREEAEARARGGGGSRRRGGPLDVERLSAPTRASRAREHKIPIRPRRASNMSWESDDSHIGTHVEIDEEGCPRFLQHMVAARDSSPSRQLEARRRDARRWWSEATRHMAALGSGLGLLLGGPSSPPRLRLTRTAMPCSAHRNPFPVRVCLLDI